MNDSHAQPSDFFELTERDQRNNIWRLTLAQALAGANAVVVYATGAIVGNVLAPIPLLATLPISIFVVGMAACILPAGAIARRYGRRTAFLTGTITGVLVGILCMYAMIFESFGCFAWALFSAELMQPLFCHSALPPPMGWPRNEKRGRCHW